MTTETKTLYWYDILKAQDHESLVKMINQAAEQGWEPIECYTAPGTFGGGPRVTDHFCLMRQERV